MDGLKQKIFETGKNLQLVSLATITEDGKPWTRYVMGSMDENLTFRCCTKNDARKVRQMENNPNVHICLGVTDPIRAKNWLQIQGVAELTTDQKERDAFWYDMLANIFEGPTDPSYMIVIVKPSHIEFGSMDTNAPGVWKP